ncbi:MAG: Rpn family recombination-promoting nuclease/putative transposase [Anaerolineales bacterium]
MAKRRLITFDWALKRLLRSKANFEILEGFLSELLKEDITIQEILESESNQETRLDKFNRVDLKVKNSKNELIIVEVQYAREYDYFHRILLGICKAITEHLHKGEAYAQVVKVISISILYFDLGQGEDYVYHGTTRFRGLHNHDELQLSQRQKELFRKEKVADIYPEYYLLKINQFDDVAKDSLDEWIYFLKNEEIKDEFRARGLRQAKKALDVLRLPDAERRAYEVYLEDLHYQASMFFSSYGAGKHEGLEEGRAAGRKEGLEEGRAAGRKEGLEEGRKGEALQIAANLLAILDDEQIASITGLPIETVKQLRAQAAG